MILKTNSEKYLVVKNADKEYPFIKIQITRSKDKRLDLRLSFIGTRHHYSLHQAKILENNRNNFLISLHLKATIFPKNYTGTKPIIFTSFDLDKPVSSLHIGIIGKHVKYYENRVLPLGIMNDYYLGGRKVFLNKMKYYPSQKCYFYETKLKELFIETYLSNTKFKKDFDLEVHSEIGYLGFLFRKMKGFKDFKIIE